MNEKVRNECCCVKNIFFCSILFDSRIPSPPGIARCGRGDEQKLDRGQVSEVNASQLKNFLGLDPIGIAGNIEMFFPPFSVTPFSMHLCAHTVKKRTIKTAEMYCIVIFPISQTNAAGVGDRFAGK